MAGQMARGKAPRFVLRFHAAIIIPDKTGTGKPPSFCVAGGDWTKATIFL
jgi:hypothetical protein